MKICSECKKEWPEDCEQAISVEKYGICMACKFTPHGPNDGTQGEFDAVIAEWSKRPSNASLITT